MRQSLYKGHKIEDLGSFEGQRNAAESGWISDSKKANVLLVFVHQNFIENMDTIFLSVIDANLESTLGPPLLKKTERSIFSFYIGTSETQKLPFLETIFHKLVPCPIHHDNN